MLTKSEKATLRRLNTEKARDNFRIGKEICRMTQLGERHRHKELREAQLKANAPKQDNTLVKNITRDIIEQLKRR